MNSNESEIRAQAGREVLVYTAKLHNTHFFLRNVIHVITQIVVITLCTLWGQAFISRWCVSSNTKVLGGGWANLTYDCFNIALLIIQKSAQNSLGWGLRTRILCKPTVFIHEFGETLVLPWNTQPKKKREGYQKGASMSTCGTS